jgi:hypothetical protein
VLSVYWASPRTETRILLQISFTAFIQEFAYTASVDMFFYMHRSMGFHEQEVYVL